MGDTANMIYFLLNEKQDVTNETINSKDILRTKNQEVVYQNDFHTWTNETVELKDGRIVKIRVVERNQRDLNK
jgi:hypothetical protein